jgi:hypothetical protein
MRPLILLPARALWTPRQRPVALASVPLPPRFGLPQSPDGKLWASGDTLAVFGPAANQPPATLYANLNTRNGHLVLEFDTTTQWVAIFAGKMPRNYAGGNIVAYLTWMAASAVTGTIGWDVTFERDVALDLDADSWATAQTVTATTVDATSGKATVTSVTITAGATGTASIAAGEDFRLRIRRDVANDTAAGNAQLLSVEVKEQ